MACPHLNTPGHEDHFCDTCTYILSDPSDTDSPCFACMNHKDCKWSERRVRG